MVEARNDDTDLTRLFAETAPLPSDEAFVARVTRHIAWRQRLILALPAGVAVLLALAIWATWPAALTFSGAAITGLVLLVQGTGAFFNSPTGVFTAVALLLTAGFWSWLYERLRGVVS